MHRTWRLTFCTECTFARLPEWLLTSMRLVHGLCLVFVSRRQEGLCARGRWQHVERVWSSGEAVGDQHHRVLVSHFRLQDEGAAQARAELDHVQHCDWRLPCAAQCSFFCLVEHRLVTAQEDKRGREGNCATFVAAKYYVPAH